MASRRLGLPLVAVWTAACGGPGPVTPDGGVECRTHASPVFELGTGAEAFESIADGQDLPMVPGPQGGCHFWLAIRTDGFPQRGTKLRYEVFYADTGTTTMSFSSFSVPLRPVDGEDGRCEAFGTTGFLIEPWRFVDERVEIRAKVWHEPGPGLEIAATDTRTVVGRWPGTDPHACGAR